MAHICSTRWATTWGSAWARGPAVSVGFLPPPPPRSVGVGCSPEQEEGAGCSGRLARPGRSAWGAGACPNQRENLIKISKGAR